MESSSSIAESLWECVWERVECFFFWLAEKAEVSRPNVLTCTEGDGQTDVEFKNGTWTLLWVRVTRPTHDGATATRVHSFGCGPAKYPIHFQPSNSHPILGVKKTRLDRIQPIQKRGPGHWISKPKHFQAQVRARHQKLETWTLPGFLISKKKIKYYTPKIKTQSNHNP